MHAHMLAVIFQLQYAFFARFLTPTSFSTRPMLMSPAHMRLFTLLPSHAAAHELMNCRRLLPLLLLFPLLSFVATSLAAAFSFFAGFIYAACFHAIVTIVFFSLFKTDTFRLRAADDARF